MTDERLIEEIKAIATKAALEVGGHAYPGFAAYDAAVLAATAVFEKAHTPTTPTDDEREAMAHLIADGQGHPSYPRLPSVAPFASDYRSADRLIAAGFRRSEPSAETEAEMHARGATAWDCPDCGNDPEDCYCGSEPQGEPSDARGIIARALIHSARMGSFGAWDLADAIVAALRSGSEVGDEGR